VVDIRHNGGGNTPTKLLTALMNKPFREWTESTLNVQLDPNAHATYRIPSELEQPDGSAYAGKLILLVDGGCGSACEDFVAPFKDNRRATIVGTETLGSTGQPYYLRFENGMSFRVSTKREFFPDGSQFEGVGIKPDVQLEPSADDLRNGKDPVLEKALELAQEATSPSQ
jgi:carboxyl-terminal processing protease